MWRSNKSVLWVIFAAPLSLFAQQIRPVTLEQYIATQRAAVDAEVQKVNAAGLSQQAPLQAAASKKKETYIVEPLLVGIATGAQTVAEVNFAGRPYYVRKGEPIGTTGWRVANLNNTNIEMTTGVGKDARKLVQTVTASR